MITISSGNLKNIKLKVHESIRPTKSIVKSAVFNMLRHRNFGEGNNFLDLFAGSGNMGIEAASHGFIPFFSEKFKSVYENLLSNLIKSKINYEEFKFGGMKKIGVKTSLNKPAVVYGDAVKILEFLNFKFDAVYIDPPYDCNIGEKILNSNFFKKNATENTVIFFETKREVKDIDDFYELETSKKYGDSVLNILKIAQKP
ncbi:MAG TPA: RsmD family RNA methyltransferase [bacterium]|nr:RsmD family RNA methyltransferase [bacterium]HPN31391.1 RsmD family RNA methyltransferase [bacterium]